METQKQMHDGPGSRKRGGGGHGYGNGNGTAIFSNATSARSSSGNGLDQKDYTDLSSEKDYLIDRTDSEEEPLRPRYSEKEKEKWSKLIPEHLSHRPPKPSRTGKKLDINGVVSFVSSPSY